MSSIPSIIFFNIYIFIMAYRLLLAPFKDLPRSLAYHLVLAQFSDMPRSYGIAPSGSDSTFFFFYFLLGCNGRKKQ
jgi:hypothetical protein